MGKQVVNRRENLLANAIPPEIADVSTLVRKTDKASASKLGLVKIGDNVNISSAGAISVPVGSSETAGVYKVGEGLSVEDGVLSATGGAGGLTVTQLFSGNVVQGDTTWKSLSEAYTGYTFLLLNMVSGANANAGELILVTNIQTAQYNTNKFGYGGAQISLRFDAEDATHFCAPSGSGTVAISIYGIK